jgi:hypothetical protein
MGKFMAGAAELWTALIAAGGCRVGFLTTRHATAIRRFS